LLVEFAGFSKFFSDVAQNITNAAYKGVGGWWSEATYVLDTMGIVVYQ